jgi:histidyl-tRNA synthetase
VGITAIRGFNDILPDEAALWRRIEKEAEGVFSSYGFSEIRPPIVEKTELFSRSIGETTDIVEKQMYSFLDRHGESLTLRPEGTAPIVRAYIEHKMHAAPVMRLFYRGPMFRYERPQKGRYRQFYQIGAEVLGEKSPKIDAEAMEMLSAFFSNLGIAGASFEINSLGCPLCRPPYKGELKKFLAGKGICPTCRERVERNPLRALDCKNPQCIEETLTSPSIQAFLCEECRSHFEGLKNSLDDFGVPYHANPRMVRGLDYYTKTTFEVISSAPLLGSQNAIAAGGRYDSLVEDLGGPSSPCFGFAIGMERTALLVKETAEPAPGAYFIFLGKEAEKKGRAIVASLRKKGIPSIVDYAGGPLKGSLKRSDKTGARYVVIIGEDELKEGVLSVKDLASGVQEKIRSEELEGRLRAQW